MITQAPTTTLQQRAPQPQPRRRFAPPTVVLAMLLFGSLALAGLLAPLIAPQDPARQDLRGRLAAPTGFLSEAANHPLGADHLGRDLLSRVLYGLRTSLGVALIGTMVGLSIGALLGLASGMVGGRFDEVVMFFVDVQLAIPFILMVLVSVAVFGTHPVVLIAVIGLAGWDGYARMVRGQVLSAKRQAYVEASRALGGRELRIALRHVLPNVGTPLVVLASFNFTSIILLESSLSYLGLGVQPPGVSLGLLIAAGREYLLTAWWITVFPSVALVLITMSVGLISDWLRDRFDPRTR